MYCNHKERGKKCIPILYRSEYPDFANGLLFNIASLNEVLPFKRYNFESGLRLFEVINSTEILPYHWSLKNHVELMNKMNIYDWNYISKQSCF